MSIDIPVVALIVSRPSKPHTIYSNQNALGIEIYSQVARRHA